MSKSDLGLETVTPRVRLWPSTTPGRGSRGATLKQRNKIRKEFRLTWAYPPALSSEANVPEREERGEARGLLPGRRQMLGDSHSSNTDMG